MRLKKRFEAAIESVCISPTELIDRWQRAAEEIAKYGPGPLMTLNARAASFLGLGTYPNALQIPSGMVSTMPLSCGGPALELR